MKYETKVMILICTFGIISVVSYTIFNGILHFTNTWFHHIHGTIQTGIFIILLKKYTWNRKIKGTTNYIG